MMNIRLSLQHTLLNNEKFSRKKERDDRYIGRQADRQMIGWVGRMDRQKIEWIGRQLGQDRQVDRMDRLMMMIDRQRQMIGKQIKGRQAEIEIHGRFKMLVEYQCEPFQQAARDLV